MVFCFGLDLFWASGPNIPSTQVVLNHLKDQLLFHSLMLPLGTGAQLVHIWSGGSGLT